MCASAFGAPRQSASVSLSLGVGAAGSADTASPGFLVGTRCERLPWGGWGGGKETEGWRSESTRDGRQDAAPGEPGRSARGTTSRRGRGEAGRPAGLRRNAAEGVLPKRREDQTRQSQPGTRSMGVLENESRKRTGPTVLLPSRRGEHQLLPTMDESERIPGTRASGRGGTARKGTAKTGKALPKHARARPEHAGCHRGAPLGPTVRLLRTQPGSTRGLRTGSRAAEAWKESAGSPGGLGTRSAASELVGSSETRAARHTQRRGFRSRDADLVSESRPVQGVGGP
eukprot:scaffold676_cov316-Pavlova_lutheri.AAC.66